MLRLAKHEPQEVSIADAEESKSSVLQVIHESEGEEDKQPQSLVLEEPPQMHIM